MKVKVYTSMHESAYIGKLHQWLKSEYDVVCIVEDSDGFFQAVPVQDIQVVSIEDQIADLEKNIKRLSMINNIPLSEEERVKIDKEYIEAVKELLRIRKELIKE